MANAYISKQLKAARVASKQTQRDVYEWLGVGQSTFSAWETGQSEPSIGIFLKLCERYEIHDILGHFMPESSLSSLEDRIDPGMLKKLLALPEDSLNAVKNCLEFEYRAAKRKRIPLPALRKIPLFTQAATAGLGSFTDDAHAELCELTAPEGADFAIRIAGDSMEPLIHNEQIVFVRQQAELSSGEIGIFLYNDESFCKIWENRTGIPKLVSLNPNYPPIPLKSADAFRVCGKVLL